MPVFLAPLFTKAGLYAVICLGLVAAALYAVHHFESIGAANAVAAQQKADQGYIDIATKKLSDWQAYWAPYASALDQSVKARDDQQKILAQLAAAGGNRACLSAPVVHQLQSLGAVQPGRPGGTAKSAGTTAGGVHQ